MSAPKFVRSTANEHIYIYHPHMESRLGIDLIPCADPNVQAVQAAPALSEAAMLTAFSVNEIKERIKTAVGVEIKAKGRAPVIDAAVAVMQEHEEVTWQDVFVPAKEEPEDAEGDKGGE